MIQIHGLTKRYGKHVALHDVDLTVPAGTAVALWGPNGAGKTTLVLCVLGFLSHQGTITVGGHGVRRDGKATRSLIGYVPQRPTFFDDLTVAESLALSAALRRLHTDRIESVMALTEISSQENTRVRALSGGARQRLALATALLGSPPVLMLDEPTSNLDAASREATLALLLRLRADGHTIVVTSHHFEEVSILVDRVVMMDEGRVVGESLPGDLAAHLGLRSWLHLVVDPASIGAAIETLSAMGLTARSNGHGLVVDLPRADKGRAISALVRAGIELRDLEVWR